MTRSTVPPDAAQNLDSLYDRFDHVRSAIDPVHRVRPFRRRADREVAGFCAAALAFGRVGSVLASIDALFQVLGPSPAAFVRTFEPEVSGPAIRPIVHRWTRGVDLIALLWILRRMLETHGSIERFFLEGYRTDAPDLGDALDSFSVRARAVDVGHIYGRSGIRRVSYFFSRPTGGSACKRLNLFLRWMVRHDQIDLGVWRHVSAAKLIVPLDTHVIRVGQCLGLTRYRSPGWAMARDITESLRRFDTGDPVKYDFALCHLGMSTIRSPLKRSRARVRPA
jgi:uncharacterized protein (TIGR02757 family)